MKAGGGLMVSSYTGSVHPSLLLSAVRSLLHQPALSQGAWTLLQSFSRRATCNPWELRCWHHRRTSRLWQPLERLRSWLTGVPVPIRMDGKRDLGQFSAVKWPHGVLDPNVVDPMVLHRGACYPNLGAVRTVVLEVLTFIPPVAGCCVLRVACCVLCVACC